MARRSVRLDGRALERLRLARGFARQGDLAEAAGVSASTVSRAETGSTETMSAASAVQLAGALGVALEALVLAADEPEPPDEVADAIANRIVDKLAERLPAIVRAIMAEQAGRPGQRGGSPGARGTASTDESDEARRLRRPAWPAPARLAAAAG